MISIFFSLCRSKTFLKLSIYLPYLSGEQIAGIKMIEWNCGQEINDEPPAKVI